MIDKAVVFDLDGTLWDATEQVAESWEIVLRKYVDPNAIFTAANAKELMGLTMEEIGRRLSADLFDEDTKARFIKECFSYEVEYLASHPGRLFEKEIETLSKLKESGYSLFIVSNCQKGYIETFLPLIPEGLFSGTLCHGDTNKSKGETILELLAKHEIKEAVYVGDTSGDETATRKAGIPFIHAAYGFGKAEAPDASVESIADLPEALLSLGF